MKVKLLKIAQAELDETFVWYEKQVIGLGYEFLDEFDKSVRLIISFSESFEEVAPSLRRCLINRFPYGIIYGLEENCIVIIAIANLRMNPNYWAGRKLS